MNNTQTQQEYRREYSKEYQKANPEQTKLSKAKWREENRKYTREYAKNYYKNNKKKYTERYEAEKEEMTQKSKDYHNTPNGKRRHTISYWKTKRKIECDDFNKLYDTFQNSTVCNKCEKPYGERGDRSGIYKSLSLVYGTNRVDCISCFRCMNRSKTIAKNNIYKSALNINV